MFEKLKELGCRGLPVYKTKEAENVIYRSLLHSYYKNITPKDGTETF